MGIPKWDLIRDDDGVYHLDVAENGQVEIVVNGRMCLYLAAEKFANRLDATVTFAEMASDGQQRLLAVATGVINSSYEIP